MFTAPSPAGDGPVDELRTWATDPARGGRIFRWDLPGAGERCREFFRDKLAPHLLDPWCRGLADRAEAELAAAPARQ